MDARDLNLSRKMQKLCRRVEQLVAKEMGEQMGVALVVFPWQGSDEPERIAEYQYVSNAPRDLMRTALTAVSDKWRAGGQDIAPHLKQ
jgi:hypothetical protein